MEQSLVVFISHLFLASARLMGFFSIVPIFASSTISGTVRTAVIVALAMPFIVSFYHTAPHADVSHWHIAGLVAKEYLLGFLLGMGVATIFWAVQAVGVFIDNQRGATIASSLDPLTGSQSSPIGMMLLHVFMVYFIISGGLHLLLTSLALSYEIWRFDSFYPTFPLEKSGYFLSMLDFLLHTAVRIAAPVIIVMMLAEWSLALISRFAPQLNVFNIAFSIKSGIAIFMLGVYVSTVMPYLRDELFEMERIMRDIMDAASQEDYQDG